MYNVKLFSLKSLSTEKKARIAVNYLFKCFTDGHPRVTGQTPQQVRQNNKSS